MKTLRIAVNDHYFVERNKKKIKIFFFLKKKPGKEKEILPAVTKKLYERSILERTSPYTGDRLRR